MTSLNPTMRIGRQIGEVTHGDAESVRLLETVGVRDAQLRLRVYPHELSGGLRQRVMAAIAVAGGASEATGNRTAWSDRRRRTDHRTRRDRAGAAAGPAARAARRVRLLGAADHPRPRRRRPDRRPARRSAPRRAGRDRPGLRRGAQPAARLHPFAARVPAEPDDASRRAVQRGRRRLRACRVDQRPALHVHRAPGRRLGTRPLTGDQRRRRGRPGHRAGRGIGDRRGKRFRQVDPAADRRRTREADVRLRHARRHRRAADGVPGRRLVADPVDERRRNPWRAIASPQTVTGRGQGARDRRRWLRSTCRRKSPRPARASCPAGSDNASRWPAPR